VKCLECGKPLTPRITYTPDRGYENSITFSHIHTLKDLMNGGACKYTITRQETNILNYDEYNEECQALGDQPLCYGAYIQCLIDSENIDQDIGNLLIQIHQKDIQKLGNTEEGQK